MTSPKPSLATGTEPLTDKNQWTLICDDPVIEHVIAELRARSKHGVAKYGVTLAKSGLSLKDFLIHALQECLDQANYLMGAIEQLDAHPFIMPAPGRPTEYEGPKTVTERTILSAQAFARDIEAMMKDHEIIVVPRRLIPEGSRLIEAYDCDDGTIQCHDGHGNVKVFQKRSVDTNATAK